VGDIVGEEQHSWDFMADWGRFLEGLNPIPGYQGRRRTFFKGGLVKRRSRMGLG